MAYKNNKNQRKQYYNYMDQFNGNGEDSFGKMLTKKGKGQPARLPQDVHMKNMNYPGYGGNSKSKYPSSMKAQNQQIRDDKQAMMRSASGKKSKY